jgi:hypothetical protein
MSAARPWCGEPDTWHDLPVRAHEAGAAETLRADARLQFPTRERIVRTLGVRAVRVPD